MNDAPRSTACPNCGAPITFRWAQAVQTTCEYCRSVLVRQGLDLAMVGKQAAFPATGSPIQLGTAGRWNGQPFTVVGRLAYAWERGRWNEWHCRLGSGESAWLSDAQLEYAMTTVADAGVVLPPPEELTPGGALRAAGTQWTVGGRVEARYVGTEGELPFTSTDRDVAWFTDLTSPDGRFATVDGSTTPPTLYVGEYVAFDDLQFTGLREFSGWPT
jgi:hypothetical protein